MIAVVLGVAQSVRADDVSLRLLVVAPSEAALKKADLKLHTIASSIPEAFKFKQFKWNKYAIEIHAAQALIAALTGISKLIKDGAARPSASDALLATVDIPNTNGRDSTPASATTALKVLQSLSPGGSLLPKGAMVNVGGALP
jgi:hypothetical protein